MGHYLKLFLSASAALSLCLSAHASNLVTNGNFATGTFSGWSLTGDSSGSYVSGSSGNYAAALTTNTTDGFLSQTLSDTSGQSYTLTFELAGDGATPNDLLAIVGGKTLVTLNNVGDTLPNYLTETATFTGTGSDTLEFEFLDNPGYLYLTDVSVNANASVVSATPEPSSLMLLATGALGIAAATRRRLLKA